MQPIGFFDSGYGGLTVFREVQAMMPEYDYLYLGDNARAPYGDKSFETIHDYTLEAVKWFFAQGCHLVVLACNTASAKALRSIQQNDLAKIAPGKRVLGVIRPTAESLGEHTRNGHVGVVGTIGTVQSGSYLIEIAKYYPEVKVTQEACPGWVRLVEEFKYDSPEADALVAKHIGNLMAQDPEIDTLLLACTHYPLLLNSIKKALPANVDIIAQGTLVARSLKDYLNRHPEIDAECTKSGYRLFFTTGNVDDFEQHASVFFGAPVAARQVKIN